jgi:hypothetical protein
MTLKIKDRKFQCEICLNDYDNQFRRPFVLVPCGHTLCNLCIDKIENKQCPNDRIVYTNKILNWEIQKRLSNYQVTSLVNEILNNFKVTDFVLDELKMLHQKKNNQINVKMQQMFALIDKKKLKIDLVFIKNLFQNEIDNSKNYESYSRRKFNQLRCEYDDLEASLTHSEETFKEFNLKLEKEMKYLGENVTQFEANFKNLEKCLQDIIKILEEGDIGLKELESYLKTIDTISLIKSIDINRNNKNNDIRPTAPLLEGASFNRNQNSVDLNESGIDSTRGILTCPTFFHEFSTRKKVIFVLILTTGLPLFLSYPISLIFMGIYYTEKCPIDKRLPVWMICYGSFGILCVIFAIILFEYLYRLVVSVSRVILKRKTEK